MLLVGLGVGPSMAGHTVVIQSVVPRDRLGVATSTLTFLRQIGGSVGLAIAGTIFASTFSSMLPTKLSAAGVPSSMAAKIAGQHGENLTGVGDMSRELGSSLPSGLLPRIVAGIHNAMATAVADLFWLPLAAGILALVTTVLIRDVPLRGTVEQAGDGELGAPRTHPGSAGAVAGQ